MEESKSSICRHLCEALKWTRAHQDILYMKYEKDDGAGIEFVHIGYKSGRRLAVDVTADSGIALIHDILKCI